MNASSSVAKLRRNESFIGSVNEVYSTAKTTIRSKNDLKPLFGWITHLSLPCGPNSGPIGAIGLSLWPIGACVLISSSSFLLSELRRRLLRRKTIAKPAAHIDARFGSSSPSPSPLSSTDGLRLMIVTPFFEPPTAASCCPELQHVCWRLMPARPGGPGGDGEPLPPPPGGDVSAGAIDTAGIDCALPWSERGIFRLRCCCSPCRRKS